MCALLGRTWRVTQWPPKREQTDQGWLQRCRMGETRLPGNQKVFEGRLLEAHIGRVVNAEFPPTAISPWDLRVDGSIYVQVKTAGEGKAFSLAGGKVKDGVAPQVWVFVVKPAEEKSENRADLDYFVLTSSEVEHERTAHKTITAKNLKQYGQCKQAELLDLVRAAAVKAR